MAATRAMSVTARVGLDGVSIQISRVFGRQRPLYRRRVGEVHEGRAESPPGEHLAQHLRGPVVGVGRRDDVVPRGERLEDGRGRGHSRGEGERHRAAFQRSERVLQRVPGGIVAPGVEEACGSDPSGMRARRWWRDGSADSPRRWPGRARGRHGRRGSRCGAWGNMGAQAHGARCARARQCGIADLSVFPRQCVRVPVRTCARAPVRPRQPIPRLPHGQDVPRRRGVGLQLPPAARRCGCPACGSARSRGSPRPRGAARPARPDGLPGGPAPGAGRTPWAGGRPELPRAADLPDRRVELHVRRSGSPPCWRRSGCDRAALRRSSAATRASSSRRANGLVT